MITTAMSTDKMMILCSLMILGTEVSGCARVLSFTRVDPSVPHVCEDVEACRALLPESGPGMTKSRYDDGWESYFEASPNARPENAHNVASAAGHTGCDGYTAPSNTASPPETSYYSLSASPEPSREQEPVVQPDAVLRDAPSAAEPAEEPTPRDAPASPESTPSAPASPRDAPSAPASPRSQSDASETAAATTPSVEATPRKPRSGLRRQRTTKKQRKQAKRDANAKKNIAAKETAAKLRRQTQYAAKAKQRQADAQLRTERANRVANTVEKLAALGIASRKSNRGKRMVNARRSPPRSPKGPVELSPEDYEKVKRLVASRNEGRRQRIRAQDRANRRGPRVKRAKRNPKRH